MSKLICITGIDGIGKSTLIKDLAAKFESCHVANVWDLLSSPVQSLPFKSKREIDDFICSLTPDSRFLFLSHALKYSIDKALEASEEIILMDSYHYKYAATELALGADATLVKHVTDSFPVSDMVIELRLSLSEIVKRKDTFSRYECGLAAVPNKKSFMQFQEQVIPEWLRFEIENHQLIDALLSPEKVAQETMELIER